MLYVVYETDCFYNCSTHILLVTTDKAEVDALLAEHRGLDVEEIPSLPWRNEDYL